MNINNTTNKSTKELKNQVLTDLKKVREDLDEIKTRMTPGQIIDDAISYRRGSSPAETFNHLKNNPIGTSFITLGTLLLMEDSEHHSFERLARDKASGVRGKVWEKIDQVQSKVSEVKENIQSKLNKTKEFGAEYDSDESFTSGSVDSAREKMQDLRGKVKVGLDSAKQRAQGVYHSAEDSVRNLDPLTYLALGAGLGAITGASLPISEKEKSFVSDKIHSKGGFFKQDLETALNESANILKNEFIGGVTNFKVNLFKSHE